MNEQIKDKKQESQKFEINTNLSHLKNAEQNQRTNENPTFAPYTEQESLEKQRSLGEASTGTESERKLSD